MVYQWQAVVSATGKQLLPKADKNQVGWGEYGKRGGAGRVEQKPKMKKVIKS